MKKLLPFVFPLIAFIIVIFLAVRWYNSKTHRNDGQIPEFAQNTQITDLNQVQLNKLKHPAKDEKSVEMQTADGATASGEVRYELQDGNVMFSVYANLPELQPGQGVYQVWLKQVNGDAKRKAFTLEYTKSGYTGSAQISASVLPFELDVVLAKSNNDVNGQLLLSGVLSPSNQ